jgi:hypothetical protein
MSGEVDGRDGGRALRRQEGSWLRRKEVRA